MPRKSAEPEVTTRLLAPTQDQTPDEDRPADSMLYRPVPQLDEVPPPFTVKYVWFTPAMADDWLKTAIRADNFKQRPMRLSQVRRWRNLYLTGRFVHFLPNQPVCVDPDGIQLNGQHRFTGLAHCPPDTKAGFMVVENVPRWMFSFFDTNSVRTLKDVFSIGSRAQDPQTGSAMKLAMRYEEFITGKRNPFGWRHWNQVRDEHQDVDSFYARREELQDWYATAARVHKASRILIPAAMVFQFYQGLAWPEGFDEIKEFTEALIDPTRLPPGHPAKLLHGWSRSVYENSEQVFAKREVLLMLLFRCFEQTQNGSRLPKLQWAYGMNMSMPYHPKGFEAGLKNVRIALDDMDAARADT